MSEKPSAIDDFVFDWFNERQPDEMQKCLDAHSSLEARYEAKMREQSQ